MADFKGTPGPWEKTTRETKRGSTHIVAIIPKYYGERRIETVLTVGYINEDDCGVESCCKIEEHANARLIAAAPDLLAFAIDFVEKVESGKAKSTDSYNKAKAAIKKALLGE